MKSLTVKDQVETVLGKTEAVLKKGIDDVVSFIKKHKRLLFAIVAVYLGYQYLFGDEKLVVDEEETF